MPSFLLPPKSPAKLALYFFVWYLVLSLVWVDIFHLPTKGTKEVIYVLFMIIGYAYGAIHHVALTFKQAFLAALYFSIPLFALRMIPVWVEGFSTVPSDELLLFLFVTLGILIIGVGLQLVVTAWLLSFLSALAVKQSKK